MPGYVWVVGRLDVSVGPLDSDTVIVRVSGEAPSSECGRLEEALQEAEELERPGLVVDLSEVSRANAGVLAAIAACQRRCIESHRWLLVVPPMATLASFLEAIP